MQKINKRNGYFYGAHTKAGFLRMQRMGIVKPPFRLENKLTQKLNGIFKKALSNLLNDFLLQTKAVVTKNNVITADGSMEDNLKELLDFFEQMRIQEEANDRVKNRMQIGSVAENLKKQWEQEEETPKTDDFMSECFDEDKEHFFDNFYRDANEEFIRVVENFTINKKELFQRNLENLKKLYLDNSNERINGELDILKKMFLQKLNDYVVGKSDTLDVSEVVDKLSNSTERMARFFARDQMARFNKALTLSTFISAGVTKIKWVTCHDSRVRESHKALDGQIFDITNLPNEVDDYNCRCGLIPVEYAE